MLKRSQDAPEEFVVSERALAHTIGFRIQSRRRALQLTQAQLRAKLGVENVYISRTQFSRLEQGESLPNAAEIIALATVLEVSFQWLLLGPEGN